MLWLTGVVGDAVRPHLDAGRIGVMDTPANHFQEREGHSPHWRWAADNGCFSARWDSGEWWGWLSTRRHLETCLFAVAPDVVGDAAATRARWDQWAGRIGDLGYPVAYVAQNGSEDVPPPWDELDALFVGGDDAFKLGPVAVRLMARAHALGKHVHMGRVNSLRRLNFAREQHADSADGTFLRWAPDVNVKRMERWLAAIDATPTLWSA